MPGIIRRQRWGSVIEGAEEDDKIRFCEKCLELGKSVPLKARLYLDDKGKALPPPIDADSWLQCWTCGWIYAVHETKVESEISTEVEIIENPFDFAKTKFIGIKGDDRLDKNKNEFKKRKKELAKIKDSEIRKYLANGYELTNYELDSSTI